MDTVETREREQHFRFPCPELGVEQSNPGEITFHTYNYLMAASWPHDMEAADRKMYMDVGCGSGHGTEMIGCFFEKSYGIDRDPLAIEYARKMHSRAGTEYLLTKDMDTKPFFKAFDFITLIEVLEHVPQSLGSALIAEIASWMKPSGTFFLSTPLAKTPDGKNPNNPWHVHEYSMPELRELLAPHFAQVKINGNNGINLFVACRVPK